MEYLRMQGITKYYHESNVLANDHVDFTLNRNEIHAIVGENGAGKTTLMKILYGLEHFDSGKIFCNDEEIKINSPLDANKFGIGMVHQHFRLIPQFSIAENVTLGIEPVKYKFLLDRKKSEYMVKQVIDEYGFNLDPGMKVSELTVGQMQQVEIVKLLYRDVDILILDEPTSVLTEQQIQKLFETLKELIKLGKTIIIITHKLDEVKMLSDRVTVMRQGKLAAVRNTAEVKKKELSTLMVGKSVIFKFNRKKMDHTSQVLSFREIVVNGERGQRSLLNKFNLDIHKGEIVGVAGVGGNGLRQLEEVVSGLRPIAEGDIYNGKEKITNLSAHNLRKRGLAYVPADRLRRGSSLGVSVLENMIISTHHSFIKFGIIDQKTIREFGDELIGKYSISSALDLPIGTLSGGNIQKVILSRELSIASEYIIFSEPTWGLDIASSEFIYEKILECRENQKAILLISSNLDEILGLADTVAVMYKGRLVGKFANTKDLTKEKIGEYMLGIRDDFKEGDRNGKRTEG